ncbi:alpha/beta fold hydrolase [Glacieibacterium frigidum]|uniref:Alpha/beta fold hydrolase n=1 Tax=Glacieibacterium frigidum TaxID=2593303 RepID=A0A552UF53_9SPHN|nr:alpha/beta fold hydrolase [Glacieibacterium frigidum]TRW16809.1 alpha/beta fold hydrolase [Glacieibacterium frigidum]
MTAASTPPLLLLPGLMCDARIFAAQLVRFGEATAIDGFGTRTDFGAMARHVLDTAPPRFSLLGHSMGARVALEVVRLAPDRVVRLALVSTGTHPVRPGEADKRRRLVEIGRTQGVSALVDEWLPPMLAPAHRTDPTMIEPLRAMCEAVGVAAFAAQIDALLSRPALETLLPAIRCPTLIAVGDADEWSPPAQHVLIRDAVPNARMTIVPGAGHMLPVEAPAALNDAIADWLSLPPLH